MDQQAKRRRSWIKLAAVITAVMLVLILTLQNMSPVDFRLFFWKQSVSPAILLPITFLLGFFAGRFGK